jgi:erythromycin esterase-like protein
MPTPSVLDVSVIPAESREADAAFLDLVGDARLVLLGEATHGTHEFYAQRAHLSRLLIEERGFSALAVEADWPDAYRVNRYVCGRGGDRDSRAALADFRRFPQWMWRNHDVVALVDWLRARNAPLALEQRVGFYGLDLYSLHHSMEAVIDYLERVDPPAALRARERYACFEDFSDPQLYGHAVNLALTADCERAVIAQLAELRRHAAERVRLDGLIAADESFCAEQNASVALAAERYYRGMFDGRVQSWNQRDRHMAATVADLLQHLQRTRPAKPAKLVLWAHNSHLGDARATEVASYGELNLGQLLRERHGKDVVSFGFTTYDGTVAAASDWGRPVECKRVRPALPDSYEEVLHRMAEGDHLLILRDRDIGPELSMARLERAIGVVYRPESERASHYFYARLRRQFDAIFHFDHTTAVTPLERAAQWEAGDLPETYPSTL